jgi:hypothetical protein
MSHESLDAATVFRAESMTITVDDAEARRYWSLVIGHWSLVIGHWSLVIGHWSLVIGHWSLVIGHWLRAMSSLA